MLLKNKLSGRRLFFGGRTLTDYSVRLKALFLLSLPSASSFSYSLFSSPFPGFTSTPILPNSSKHLLRTPYTSASFLSTSHPPQHTNTCPSSGMQAHILYFFFICLHHIVFLGFLTPSLNPCISHHSYHLLAVCLLDGHQFPLSYISYYNYSIPQDTLNQDNLRGTV